MEFKDFARKLHSIIGGASSTHAFTKALFETIVNDENLDLLSAVGNETYKAYFNGNTGITRLAKKISPYLEPEDFYSYIDEFPDATQQGMVNAFEDDIPDLTAYNVAEKLSALFEDIIRTAASSKRKAPKPKVNPEPSDDDVIQEQLIKSATVIADVFGAAKHKMADDIRNRNTQKNATPASTEQMIAIQSFSKEYYQLLVTTEEGIFETNIITMPASRALSKGLVPDEIFDRCSSLTDAGKAELKTFPALICQENTELKGKTDPNQYAVYGYLRKVMKDGKNIKIIFESLGAIPQKLLCDEKNAIFFDLRMDCAITDLNRTQWSVHKANMFEAFIEAGITNLPVPEQ